MLYNLIIFSLTPALLIFMLDYGLGHPADEKPGYGSFLFVYSLWLARKVNGDPYRFQYEEQNVKAKTNLEKHQIKRTYQELTFLEGRQLFTWQKVIGMCPYCTHFWFTLIYTLSVNIFYYKENIIILVFYFLLSHATLRFLKRYM